MDFIIKVMLSEIDDISGTFGFLHTTRGLPKIGLPKGPLGSKTGLSKKTSHQKGGKFFLIPYIFQEKH